MKYLTSDKPKDVLRAEMLALATDKEKTPFDYVIIGSGAGGGPLAARLARAGRTVLLLEAGADPAAGPVAPAGAAPFPPYQGFPPGNGITPDDVNLLKETTEVPG